MRRWMQEAARGEIYATPQAIQKALNKWLPRGLEMFGDERGGASNIRMGFKDQTNQESLDAYYLEVTKMVRDLNLRYLRERLPNQSSEGLDKVLADLELGHRSSEIEPDEILRLPAKGYFRRRGVSAYQMIGCDGRTYKDFQEYRQHLQSTLPESYLASQDFRHYLELLKQVSAGEVSIDEAQQRTPQLSRVGGSCPCSKSVRWIMPENELSAVGSE